MTEGTTTAADFAHVEMQAKLQGASNIAAFAKHYTLAWATQALVEDDKFVSDADVEATFDAGLRIATIVEQKVAVHMGNAATAIQQEVEASQACSRFWRPHQVQTGRRA